MCSAPLKSIPRAMSGAEWASALFWGHCGVSCNVVRMERGSTSLLPTLSSSQGNCIRVIPFSVSAARPRFKCGRAEISIRCENFRLEWMHGGIFRMLLEELKLSQNHLWALLLGEEVSDKEFWGPRMWCLSWTRKAWSPFVMDSLLNAQAAVLNTVLEPLE